MAAATVHSVVDGWAGDSKRQRVILTAASTDSDTLAPVAVGLSVIEAIVPTGRIGTIPARQGTEADVVAAVVTSYNTSSTLLCTAAKFEAFIYGK